MQQCALNYACLVLSTLGGANDQWWKQQGFLGGCWVSNRVHKSANPVMLINFTSLKFHFTQVLKLMSVHSKTQNFSIDYF